MSAAAKSSVVSSFEASVMKRIRSASSMAV